MQRPWAALILVLFVSNSIAEDKNGGINNNNPIFSEDILNLTETDDVTQFVDQIINKLNDNPISKDREETFVLDSKVGNVKVENQQSGKGKYKIVINKKHIKNKPRKSVRTYKIKVKSKARVQPKKITFETNTQDGADINTIISKFISETEKPKNINTDTTSDNVQAFTDSDQLRKVLIKFIQNIQANSGSKIDDNANLDKLLSYLWTIIKSKADAQPTENHENLAVITLNDDKYTPEEVYQQSSGNVGPGAEHGRQTTFHLPYQTTNQKVQNPKKSDDQSFKSDDIQALINKLTQKNGNVNNLFTVGSLTPLNNLRESEKDQIESLKELVKEKGLSQQENAHLDDSHMQGLVSKLCDAAKNNVIEFWDLLLRYLGSNDIGDKTENEANKNSPFYEMINEILKKNNKDLKNHDPVKSDFLDRKKVDHKDEQFKYSTVEQTTTTPDATVELHNKKILTPSENLARYGDLINNPGSELVTLEKNNSYTTPQYDIEITTQSSVIELHPESDNNTLKYQKEDPNPNLLLENDNGNYEQDEPNIAQENNEKNTLDNKKPNWLRPSTDNLGNLVDHKNDKEPHEHYVDDIDKELHPSNHGDVNDDLLHPSYDVHKNDNKQHPSDHVNENHRQPHPSDYFNENVKNKPPSYHVNENDIVLSPSDHLNENVKEKAPSNYVNGNYTKPIPPYYVIEHDKLPYPFNNVNENDIVSYPSDHENVKETPFNHVNGNYTELLPPYLIEHDKLPHPSNDVSENDNLQPPSDHLNENVRETPPSNNDNGNYTEPLHPSNHVNEDDIVPSASDYVNKNVKETPLSNHVNGNYTESLLPYYVIEHDKLPYPSNHFNENDKQAPPLDLVNEKNKIPFPPNYFIQNKLPHASNHFNGDIVYENDSEEKESGVEETSEDKTQVVDQRPDSSDYEFDTISTESPEFSQEISIPAEGSFVNNYPLNQKTILQYLNPQGKIKNDELKDYDEYLKYIYSLPMPLLQSLLLSIDKELNADADPSKLKVNPDNYLLLDKLLQLNLNPHIKNYNKNVHSVVNKHKYPDFYIILNKLKDLGKKKNKESQSKTDINQIPDDQTISEKFPDLNKNINSRETLNNLIEYLKSSLPDDPSDCRLKSYNEILEKIIRFFQL